MEDNSAKISVIIPAYNCQSTIENNVKAILQSTYLPYEIIIVDDASTDNTWNIVQQLAQKYPLIKCFRKKYNGGPGKTRNQGAQEATGEYLFFLDSDTRILPDALERFSKHIKNYDSVIGVYDAVPINTDSLSAWYKALLYSHLYSRCGLHPYDQFSASCAGIKRSVYLDVGGYNEWFKAGVDFENEELGHRIIEKYSMVVDPEIRAAHLFPGSIKMTRTFFHRTALWVEMFATRRKFNSSANSPGTGITTMALLISLFLFSFAFLTQQSFVYGFLTYLIFLLGYIRFYAFVSRHHGRYLLPIIVLNHYYSLIISLGACFGLLRVLTGKSLLFKRFSNAES